MHNFSQKYLTCRKGDTHRLRMINLWKNQNTNEIQAKLKEKKIKVINPMTFLHFKERKELLKHQ